MISVTEAAAYLGVSERRVRVFISEGRLQATKVAGVWLVNAHSLARLRETERKTGRPPKAAE